MGRGNRSESVPHRVCSPSTLLTLRSVDFLHGPPRRSRRWSLSTTTYVYRAPAVILAISSYGDLPGGLSQCRSRAPSRRRIDTHLERLATRRPRTRLRPHRALTGAQSSRQELLLFVHISFMGRILTLVSFGSHGEGQGISRLLWKSICIGFPLCQTLASTVLS